MQRGASLGVAVLLALTLPTAGEAGSRFWLVDANDQFIGEVVDMPDQFRARIRFQGGGHDFYAVAIAGLWTLSMPQPLLRFLSPGCVGDPYFEAEGLESYLLPYALWGNPTRDHVAIPDRALAPTDLVTESYMDGSGVCHAAPGEQVSVFPSFTAPLPTGVTPFRVIPNPNEIFADAFELGNPSHWSLLGP